MNDPVHNCFEKAAASLSLEPRPIKSEGCVATRREAYSLSRLNSVRPAWRRLASDPLDHGAC